MGASGNANKCKIVLTLDSIVCPSCTKVFNYYMHYSSERDAVEMHVMTWKTRNCRKCGNRHFPRRTFPIPSYYRDDVECMPNTATALVVRTVTFVLFQSHKFTSCE